MQTFEKRNTYTPTNISHVCSNCDQTLKDPREKVGVFDLKTSSNNPDATLTAGEQQDRTKNVSVVYVLDINSKPLMPMAPRKAKKLLKAKKAKVVNQTPFTIKLLYKSGFNKQKISLGVDSGYNNIGLSCISENKELYAAEIKLREDIVKLNSERRQ